jgi:5-methylcytosine-specific restriction enzyme subunit McrC
MALIYPKTPTFSAPLPPFDFTPELRLWVLPFDLYAGSLMLPIETAEWPTVGSECEAQAA